MANIPLLLKTLDHIRGNPEEWFQATWRCHTGLCFAGHAAVLAGATWVVADDEDEENPQYELVQYPDGSAVAVDYAEAFAIRALDIDDDQAYRLFQWDNSIAVLEQVVTEIVEAEEKVQKELVASMKDGQEFYEALISVSAS